MLQRVRAALRPQVGMHARPVPPVVAPTPAAPSLPPLHPASLRPALRLPPHLLARARVLPDRLSLLPLLPKGGTVVEVGVALGDFSERLIHDCEAAHFVAIDNFRLHELPSFWGYPPEHWFGALTHAAHYRRRFDALIQPGRVTVLERDSAEALAGLADASVDILYLDADHSYESVARELAIVGRKMRPNGTLVLNDYVMHDSTGPYGVVRAANEFMVREGWEMTYFALEPNMYCDVALRKLA